MGKPIDDTELLLDVAIVLVGYEVEPDTAPHCKGNISSALVRVCGALAYDDKSLTRRIQKKFKVHGPAYMRDAIDRRAATLRAEQRALAKLRASLL